MSTIELPYDLKAACQYNGIDISDVTKILLEITGEKDECDWHWIVKTKEGYAYIAGGCSYTGWDYGNTVDRHNGSTFKAVLKLCPLDVRRVFEDMKVKKETRRDNTGGL